MGNPFVDFVPIKTVVAADLEKWRMGVAEQSVDLAGSTLQMLSQLANRY
jgi:hypothetical protein